MGQQQLILLVLGIVLVGLAVVAGIGAFAEGRRKATIDTLLYESRVVMTDVEAYYAKPTAMGGPRMSYIEAGNSPVQDFWFGQMGYPDDRIVPGTPYRGTCLRLSDGGFLGVGRSAGLVDGQQVVVLTFLAMNPTAKERYVTQLPLTTSGPGAVIGPTRMPWDEGQMDYCRGT